MDLRLGLLSRRSALRRLSGLSALAAGGLGVAGGVSSSAPADAAQARSAAQPAPPDEPQPREFTMTAQEFEWELMPGTTVRAWGYDGQVPGPELRVREGDLVRVALRNALPVPTTIHWHGINLPPAMDGPAGLNQAAVEPGAEFVYEFVAKPAGSRWYHSHADPALQVPLGLGASVLDLLRLSGALVLDALLASVLLPSEGDRDEREHDRDDEELQPVPDRLPAELPVSPRLALARVFSGPSSRRARLGFVPPPRSGFVRTICHLYHPDRPR